MGDVVKPWDKRAEELEPTEGPYCAYAAWREWMDNWNKLNPIVPIELDEVEMVALWSAFGQACSETKPSDEQLERYWIEKLADCSTRHIKSKSK